MVGHAAGAHDCRAESLPLQILSSGKPVLPPGWVRTGRGWARVAPDWRGPGKRRFSGRTGTFRQPVEAYSGIVAWLYAKVMHL